MLTDEALLPQPPDDPARHHLSGSTPLGSRVEEHLLELKPGEVPERREEHEHPHLPRARCLSNAIRKGRISRQRRRRSNGPHCVDGFVDANRVLVWKRTIRAGGNHRSGPPSPYTNRISGRCDWRLETRLEVSI